MRPGNRLRKELEATAMNREEWRKLLKEAKTVWVVVRWWWILDIIGTFWFLLFPANGRNSLLIWRVGASVLNKQSWTAARTFLLAHNSSPCIHACYVISRSNADIRVLLETEMNLRLPKRTDNIFTSSVAISFFRSPLTPSDYFTALKLKEN